jgi:hypothetical protein
MGRSVAAIVAGIVVGMVTGVAAWNFVMAATWSSIHGGMSEMVLAVLSLVAMAVPVGCGFLAFRAVAGSGPRRGTSEMPEASSPTSPDRPATSAPSPRLNCPYCGCTMERPADYAATPPYEVMECPIHGPLHFGPSTTLTLGRPPKT